MIYIHPYYTNLTASRAASDHHNIVYSSMVSMFEAGCICSPFKYRLPQQSTRKTTVEPRNYNNNSLSSIPLPNVIMLRRRRCCRSVITSLIRCYSVGLQSPHHCRRRWSCIYRHSRLLKVTYCKYSWMGHRWDRQERAYHTTMIDRLNGCLSEVVWGGCDYQSQAN